MEIKRETILGLKLGFNDLRAYYCVAGILNNGNAKKSATYLTSIGSILLLSYPTKEDKHQDIRSFLKVIERTHLTEMSQEDCDKAKHCDWKTI